jgi:multidrug efflux pump subunit AcrA (membrane-fusion protein)
MAKTNEELQAELATANAEIAAKDAQLANADAAIAAKSDELTNTQQQLAEAVTELQKATKALEAVSNDEAGSSVSVKTEAKVVALPEPFTINKKKYKFNYGTTFLNGEFITAADLLTDERKEALEALIASGTGMISEVH